MLETCSAMSLFPLGHMCSLVLSKAQSAAIMRSPGADFALREEVFVYSYLTLFLTSLFFGLLDPIDIVPLKFHWFRNWSCWFWHCSCWHLEKIVTGLFVINDFRAQDDIREKTKNQISALFTDLHRNIIMTSIQVCQHLFMFYHYIMCVANNCVDRKIMLKTKKLQIFRNNYA